MERDARYLLVGLLLVVAIGVTIGFVLWTSKNPDQREGKPVIVEFDHSVSGLNKGSTVKYLGVPVGTVTGLRLQQVNAAPVVQVTVIVDAELPLSDQTRARLASSGLTGQSTIELDPGEGRVGSPGQHGNEVGVPPGPITTDGHGVPVIRGEGSVLGHLARAAPVIADRTEQVLGQMSDLFSEPNRELTTETLRTIGEASREFATTAREMQQLVAELRQTNQALNTMIPHYDAVANRLYNETLPAYRETATDFRETALILRGTATGIAQEMRQNSTVFRDFIADSRISMHTIRDQILQTAQKAEQFTEELRANPSRLVYKPPENGLELDR